MFVFLYIKANSKEICEEISFPSFFFREMLISAFLFRFKATYLEKLRGYHYFHLWIPIALAKIYFSAGPNLVQKPLCLVGTIPKVTTHIAGREEKEERKKKTN